MNEPTEPTEPSEPSEPTEPAGPTEPTEGRVVSFRRIGLEDRKSRAEAAFSELPEYVGIALGGEPGQPDGQVFVILRAPSPPSEDLGRRLIVCGAGLNFQVGAISEDDFPPQGIDLDDPDGDLKGALCRCFIGVPEVLAIYYNAADRSAQVRLSKPSPAFWNAKERTPEGVKVQGFTHDGTDVRDGYCVPDLPGAYPGPLPLHVFLPPADWVCIFNAFTRRLYAEARLPPPEERTLPCRWCGERISAAPGRPETCERCGALLPPVTINTRGKTIGRIDLYVNPDDSLYLEVVHTPPPGARYDLSRVVRYVLGGPSAVFEQHPFGRRRADSSSASVKDDDHDDA